MNTNKIDIGKLLDGCEKTRCMLYCPLFPTNGTEYNCIYEGVVTLLSGHGGGEVTALSFRSLESDGCVFSRVNLNSYGEFFNGGELMVFPSATVRDWGCFNTFYIKACSVMSIGDRNAAIKALCEKGGKNDAYNCVGDNDFIWYIDRIDGQIKSANRRKSDCAKYILDMGTELKYRDERHEIAKVGDVIIMDETDAMYMVVEDSTLYDNRKEYGYVTSIDSVAYKNGRLATPEEIECWNGCHLEEKRLHYSASKHKLIDWFKEYDKVLVRNDKKKVWPTRQFDRYDGVDKVLRTNYYCQDGLAYIYCIPYSDKTSYLIGKSDEPRYDW